MEGDAWTGHLFAAVFIGSGLLAARLSYNLINIRRQGRYLADIVERNADRLDEFDLIALRDLGILKEE